MRGNVLQTPKDLARELGIQTGVVRTSSFDANWSGVEAFVVEQQSFCADAPRNDFHVLELCLAGKHIGINDVENRSGGKDVVWRPGGLFFTAAGNAARVETEGLVTNFQITLSRQIMDDVKSEMLVGDPEQVELLSYNECYDATLRGLAQAVHHELVAPSAGGALVADAMAQAICVALVRRNPSGRKAPALALDRLSPVQLGRALDRIEAGLHESLGVADLAAASGVVPVRFARAFRMTMGITPHQYIIARRLETAKSMLKGDEPIAAIAYACGFSSQSHMTALFSEHIGMPPGRYRKALRE
ncbi:MAG: AraC family transcriptional regulator [Pseudomonadota bacterium]